MRRSTTGRGVVGRTTSTPVPLALRAGMALAALAAVLLAAGPVSGVGPAGARPASAEEACRDLPVDADGPLRSALARDAFEVDGRGTRVGIISSSFDVAEDPASDADDDVARGVLPGLGNPCGHEQPVEVLVEGPEGSDDEGRAMAQVVHGIAPGATLVFASAQPDQGAAIRALVDADVDIIVDDVWTPAEPFFQRGLFGNAVQEAVDRGVAYVASAGNLNVIGAPGHPSEGHPIGGWQTAAYRPMACPEAVVVAAGGPVDCLDVDPGPGEAPTNGVTLAAGGSAPLVAQWSDAMGTPSGTVLDLWLLTETGEVAYAFPGTPDFNMVFGALVNEDDDEPVRLQLAIVRRLDVGTPATPALRWMLANYSRTPSIVDLEFHRTVGDDVVGVSMGAHAAYGAAIPVAAADWRAPHVVEPFSSLGPVVQLVGPQVAGGPPAPPLDEPVVVPGPSVTGVDGMTTTFFPARDPSHRFFGTSASAPSVAGVLALARQAAPTASVADLRAALEATAQPMDLRYPPEVASPERVHGAGLADAHALLTAVAPTPPPPTTTTTTPSTTTTTTTTPSTSSTTTSAPSTTSTPGGGSGPGSSRASGRGTLPTTGTNAGSWVVLGMALVTSGALLALGAAARRRRR